MKSKIKCKGCTHLKYLSHPEDYCYMFEKKPEIVPCKQHDKFKEEREVMKELILKQPNILSLFVHIFNQKVKNDS
jgi:hypothetical protein